MKRYRTASTGLQAAAICAPQRLSRRGWLGLVGGACGLLATGSLAQPAPASRAGSAAPSFYENFAGMRLLDQGGKTLQLPALKGRVVLINFIFTGCSTVCPVQTHALAELQRQMKPELRRRVWLLSVSLDALSDTPQTLRAFAAKYQVDHANWSFVTGRPQDIQRLAEALWLFRNGKGQGPLEEHTTHLWLVDGQGVLRMRYGGSPPDTGRLVREMAALVEVSAPNVPREAERRR